MRRGLEKHQQRRKNGILETFDLASGVVNGGLRQSLKYSFSYTVQAGDNLTNIAKKFKTSVESIMTQNGINNKDKDKLEVGQKLKFKGFVNGSSGGGGGAGNDF